MTELSLPLVLAVTGRTLAVCGTALFVALLAGPALAQSSDVYVVQPGDTLSRIAERFGVTVDALAKANLIVNRDALQVGQELTILAP